MVAIRFSRSCPPYMPGEVAGFDVERAARFVRAGTASYVVEAALASEPPEAAAVVMPEPPATTAMSSPVRKPARRGR